MKNTIQSELKGVVVFVGVLWLVLILDWLIPYDFVNWGLTPRSAWGLVGILTSPFLHADIFHLLSNTVPLVILLSLMAGSRTRTWPTVAEIIFAGGVLLWLFGRNGTDNQPITHVGASGLVYGLIAFLIVAGFREKRAVPLLIAIVVGFLYGGTLVSGVMPGLSQSNVSWDGHLAGAVAGGALAFFTLGNPDAPTTGSPTPLAE